MEAPPQTSPARVGETAQTLEVEDNSSIVSWKRSGGVNGATNEPLPTKTGGRGRQRGARSSPPPPNKAELRNERVSKLIAASLLGSKPFVFKKRTRGSRFQPRSPEVYGTGPFGFTQST